jgi:hypothetical protein
VSSSAINKNCYTAVEITIYSQVRDHAAGQHSQSVMSATNPQKYWYQHTHSSSSKLSGRCNNTTYLHHAGTITQGEEGEASVCAAERDPAAPFAQRHRRRAPLTACLAGATVEAAASPASHPPPPPAGWPPQRKLGFAAGAGCGAPRRRWSEREGRGGARPAAWA